MVVFNWQGTLQIAPIAEATKASDNTHTSGSTVVASPSSSSSNTIQLSVKEESEEVYRWVRVGDGTINPTIKVSPNTDNLIKIQNPTETKHALIIDTNTQSSSGDINPDRSGQLSFKPTETGTFAYHCAYHPQTMKGTIQVVSGP